MPEPLSPEVAELVEKVNARVAAAATAQEIRELAASARDSALSMSEIGELFTVAIERARKVEALASRLAALTGDGNGP